jgi:hypothetical protein
MRAGSSVSLGQKFGTRISFKQDAFQYNPAFDNDRPAFASRATATISLDSG